MTDQLDKRNNSRSPADYPLYWVTLGALTGIGTCIIGLFVHPVAGLGFMLSVLGAIAIVIYEKPLSLLQMWEWAIAHHVLISRLLGGMTLCLFSLSALYFAAYRQEQLHIATPLMVMGSLMLGVALLVNWHHFIEERPPSPARLVVVNRPERRIRWLPTLVGVGLLLLMAEINGNIFNPEFLRHVNSNDQFLILVEGVLFLAWGLAGKRVIDTADHPTIRERLRAIDWRYMLAITSILALAFAVRWWQLNDAVRLFVDEIHFSNPVVNFYDANDIELLRPFSSVAAFPYLYPYMQYYAVEALGRTLEGLRAVSVLFGVLNVGAVYLLTKEMFGKQTALLAMLFLAIYPPHVQFSRIGLNNIADPVFGTMTLYFLLKGIKPKHDMRTNFAWAGAMLGLTQYFYEGGRLLYPALAITWLAMIGLTAYVLISWRAIVAYIRRDAQEIMTARRRIAHVKLGYLLQSTLVFMVVFVLVSLPVYYTLVGLNKPLISRMETAGVSERITDNFTETQNLVQHITNRFQEAFLIHVAIPESSLYYAGETALILSFVVPFFFLGMFYTFWRLDRAESSLLLLWIISAWMGNTLMQQSRISARYVVEFPALAIAVGVGLRYAMVLLFPENPRTRNRLLTVIVSMFIVFHVTYFFGPHLAIFNVQFREDINRDRDSDDVLFRSAGFPENTQIHLIGDPVIPMRDANNIINFLTDGLGMVVYTRAPEEFDTEYLNGLNQTHHHAFYIAPDDEASLDLIREYFPDVVGPFYSDYDIPRDKQFVLYYSRGFFTPLHGEFPEPEP